MSSPPAQTSPHSIIAPNTTEFASRSARSTGRQSFMAHSRFSTMPNAGFTSMVSALPPPPASTNRPVSSAIDVVQMTNGMPPTTQPVESNPPEYKAPSPAGLALQVAALPSFSGRLSEFAQMPVVPGELLSGCMRIRTRQVGMAKVRRLLMCVAFRSSHPSWLVFLR